MRLAAAALALVCLASSARAASPPWTNVLDVPVTSADKDLHRSGNQPIAPTLSLDGESIGSALPITTLPFQDIRNSCIYGDNYEVACPYGPFSAPDVVYHYAPHADESISIDLCHSHYDTQVYVFDFSSAVVVACNDDAGCGITGYQSALSNVPLLAGHDYYIVVDGYGGDCGDYELNVTAHVSCFSCSNYDQPEGEPACYDNYDDRSNGGCNAFPAVFSPVSCGTICGTTGTYFYANQRFRDTDWYEITVGPGNYTYTGVGDGFELLMYVLTPTCPPALVAGIIASPCRPATLSFTGPGTFHLFAATNAFTGIPCGSAYRLDIQGPGVTACLATRAAATSWGALKIRYR